MLNEEFDMEPIPTIDEEDHASDNDDI